MTDKATIDSKLQAFYKEMGWDEPEYGWTKEKKALKSLLLEVVREERQRIIKMLWEIHVDEKDEGAEEYNRGLDRAIYKIFNESEKVRGL